MDRPSSAAAEAQQRSVAFLPSFLPTVPAAAQDCGLGRFVHAPPHPLSLPPPAPGPIPGPEQASPQPGRERASRTGYRRPSSPVGARLSQTGRYARPVPAKPESGHLRTRARQSPSRLQSPVSARTKTPPPWQRAPSRACHALRCRSASRCRRRTRRSDDSDFFPTPEMGESREKILCFC